MKVEPRTVYVIDLYEGVWRTDERLHKLLMDVGCEMEWNKDSYQDWRVEPGTREEVAEEHGELRAELNEVLKSHGYTPEDDLMIHFWW